MKLLHLIGTIWAACTLSACHTETLEVTSPNGHLQVTVHQASNDTVNPLTFSIHYQGKAVLTQGNLGIETNRQKWTGKLTLQAVSEPRYIHEDYHMPTGKRSHCVNEAYERTYSFLNLQGQQLDITFRAYNDGVAFRYKLTAATDQPEHITQEHTAYNVTAGVKRWIQPYDPGYERFYPLSTDGKNLHPRQNNRWGYPALIEWSQNLFLLLTEANMQRNHCGSLLSNATNSHCYQVVLADQEQPVTGTWQSPWRLLIVGSLADVVASTLVTDVSEPSKVTDTTWIQPGLVSWIYWAHNHGSRNCKLLKEYVDLAAEMNWPYSLVDAEWHEMGQGGTIEDVLQHAHQKKVKPLVWYNSTTNWIDGPGPHYRLNKAADRQKEYQWLKDHGVAGIKVDFFTGDLTKTMNYYLDLLEDAIPYQIMLNFHGSNIPRGWQRTYPHLMSMEGVYGAEWYNNAPVLTPEAAKHNATLPFTRNVIGSMDYTPGTFSDSQHPHITSHGHELALPVIFESSLQHMPDRPEVYRQLPTEIKDLLSSLPTAWDDTRLLSGYPGEEVVLARRKENTWYIGGINGTDEVRSLKLCLKDFVAQEKHLTLILDGKDNRNFTIQKEIPLTSENENMVIDCLPRGGFVAIIQ